MTNKKFLILFMAFTVLPAKADPAGATDAAMLAKLSAMLTETRKQLEQFRKMTSVSEQIKEMQQNKLVKEISSAGRELGKSFSEIDRSAGIIDDIKDDPFGTDGVTNEVESYKSRVNQANAVGGYESAKRYARIARSLESSAYLGKAVRANKDRLAKGVDEKESTNISASSTTILADIAQKKQEDRERVKGINQQSINAIFSNPYGTGGNIGLGAGK